MKLFATSIAVLLSLAPAAFAEPAPPSTGADGLKVHFALRETAAAQAAVRTFDVVLAGVNPCASAKRKGANHVEIQACVSDRNLELSWSAQNAAGEYESRSSVPIGHGSTFELGTSDGPHLTVTIQ
jgi:hypothetical protein